MGEYYICCYISYSGISRFCLASFLCDFILELEDSCFAKYADDTTPYMIASNTVEVMENLTSITKKLFIWFANNQMKANHDKCHLLLSTHPNSQYNNKMF